MSSTGAESEKRKPESPPPMEPEAIGDGQTQPLKKLKEEPLPASLTACGYEMDFSKYFDMQTGETGEWLQSWPLPCQQDEVHRIIYQFRSYHLNPKGTGDIRSSAERMVDQAVKKAEKEKKESGLSPEQALDVYEKELLRLYEEFLGDYQDWYTASKKAASSIQTFYQSQKNEFSSTFTDYFESEEAIQTLLSDKKMIYSLLVEHPKLMRMLQEKLKKLEQQ